MEGVNGSNLGEVFEEIEEKYQYDYLKFDRVVKNRLHPLHDICGLLLLYKLVPSISYSIIIAAEHDVVYLDVDCDKLVEAAMEEDLVDLIRCGVHYDSESGSLAMFV